MSDKYRTRYGRSTKKPDLYEPDEIVEDDYSDYSYSSEEEEEKKKVIIKKKPKKKYESSDGETIDGSDSEEESNDDSDSEADDEGNLKGFVVYSEDEVEENS